MAEPTNDFDRQTADLMTIGPETDLERQITALENRRHELFGQLSELERDAEMEIKADSLRREIETLEQEFRARTLG